MELHKVQEWEAKKPYDVSFVEMKLNGAGSALRVVGHEDLNGNGKLPELNKSLVWESNGECYELMERHTEYSCKLRNIMQNELRDSPADHPQTFFVRNERYDIRW